MTREILNALVISTAHIRETTLSVVNNASSLTGEYGNLIYIHQPQNSWPEDLVAIAKIAATEKADYIMLDRDGPIYDDLEQFNW